MKTYFVADLHFDDDRILRYENRPFSGVQEMNRAIIEGWNSLVNPEDRVYVIGDIGNSEYLASLKGIKYLVKGNHDTYDNVYYRRMGFEEVYDMPVIFEEFWILSHEPMYVNGNMPYANIFGHVHNNPNYCSVSSQGICVSVERIGYKPISFEEIKQQIAKKTKVVHRIDIV